MERCYTNNGLVFWSQEEIRLREYMLRHFAERVYDMLFCENRAWQMVRVEAPSLTPAALTTQNYTGDDMFILAGDLVLRPETTPGSYAYARHLLENHGAHRAPLIVWQAGKSFRREQDQTTKNMRLKEFWQQEFQCIYAADTMNNYHAAVLQPMRFMLADLLGYLAPERSRVVKSDRLPPYSETTMDVELLLPDGRWMEVCSISRRTDFPTALVVAAKAGSVEKRALVLEIAIGLDRCLYCYAAARER